MRQFFKFTFASCLGTILALGFIVFLFMFIGMSTATKPSNSKNTVLELNFDKLIPDLSNNVSQNQFPYNNEEYIGLNDLAKVIRHAATDDNVKGLLLRTENTSLNPTTALHISNLIKEFAESGKLVSAYGKYFTQSGYLLASNADSVFLNPNGLVDLRGYGYTIPYFKDFSDKTDIHFDVYFAGRFKSAIEPYILEESSDANRYQTREFLYEYQNFVTDEITQNRGITKEEISRIIYNGLSNNSEDAINLGLVDEVIYFEEFEDRLKNKLDLNKINFSNLDDYWSAYSKEQASAQDRIAVVYAEGEIGFSGKNRGTITMERYGKTLDRIKNNKKIKGVILRVNSPGGSSLTSDLFWNKIEEIKKAGKFVVASFGKYAASGGYYIACGADQIVAEPTSLTGSIGVFSMLPDMSEFFDNKLGIDWDTIGTGKRTFLYSTMVARSQADHQLLMNETERIYSEFKNRVAQGRNMTPEEVEAVAQGRVWSGNQAVGIGLVDTLGSLEDAIHLAADHLELDEYKVLEYPIISKSFYEQLLSDIMAGADTQLSMARRGPTTFSKEFLHLLNHLENLAQGPQARLPFVLLEH